MKIKMLKHILEKLECDEHSRTYRGIRTLGLDYSGKPTEKLHQFAGKLCVINLMHASKGILNLPTSSLHLCSPFQQNH